MKQVELNFQGGLTDQFPDFMDCIRESVYGCGKVFKSIASDLDMSPSELSRKLADNPSDNVNFALKVLPDLIRSTNDKRPIYWLIETFLEDTDAKRKNAIDQLALIMPQILSLVKTASVSA